MEASHQQKEHETEAHFKIQLREVKTKSTKLEEALAESGRRVEELEEAVFML
jgi:hypothetical protein